MGDIQRWWDSVLFQTKLQYSRRTIFRHPSGCSK